MSNDCAITQKQWGQLTVTELTDKSYMYYSESIINKVILTMLYIACNVNQEPRKIIIAESEHKPIL